MLTCGGENCRFYPTAGLTWRAGNPCRYSPGRTEAWLQPSSSPAAVKGANRVTPATRKLKQLACDTFKDKVVSTCFHLKQTSTETLPLLTLWKSIKMTTKKKMKKGKGNSLNKYTWKSFIHVLVHKGMVILVNVSLAFTCIARACPNSPHPAWPEHWTFFLLHLPSRIPQYLYPIFQKISKNNISGIKSNLIMDEISDHHKKVIPAGSHEPLVLMSFLSAKEDYWWIWGCYKCLGSELFSFWPVYMYHILSNGKLPRNI